jgi:YggT family protein
MFIFSNFLNSVATLIDFVLSAYMRIVIRRPVISRVNADPYNPIVRFLREVPTRFSTESGVLSPLWRWN